MRHLALTLLVVLVASTGALAGATKAQLPGDFRLALSGKTTPMSLKLKDLNNTWRRFTLLETGGMAGIFGPTTTSGSAYYTKGETVAVAGETFLIAYRQKGTQVSFYEMMIRGGRGAEMEELTGESAVTLCLLSVRNLPGMNDIRPFSLEEELAEYRQAKEKTAQMIAEMGSVSGGDSENLKQLALAVMMYSVDYDVMPALDDPETAKAGLIEYVADESAFTDPETGEPYGVNPSISGMSFSEIEDVAKMVVFYQVEPGPDGKRGVAFADGHVQRVSEAEWEELRESSGIE